MPPLQQGAKVIEKKKLYKKMLMLPKMFLMEIILKQKSASATKAPSLPSQNSLYGQSGAGKTSTKQKAQGAEISLLPGKKSKTSRQHVRPEQKFSVLK